MWLDNSIRIRDKMQVVWKEMTRDGVVKCGEMAFDW